VARLAAVIAAAACLSAVAAPASATAAYTGHRLYALASGSTTGRLVPFDVGPSGQLTERADQGITVAGATTGLLVDRGARAVYVSSRDVYSGSYYYSSTPGMIAVYKIAADGSLTLAQTLTSSRFAMALTPDGSRLFAQKLNGEIDSYPVLADGTLGAETAPFPFTQPANMLALSPDGRTLYMDGQNGLSFQWAIGPGSVLTFLSPGVFGTCYSPFIGFAQGSGNVDFQCFNGLGYTYTAGADGALTPNGGAFASSDGQHGNAEDVRGRGFYSGLGSPGIVQLKREANGRLAPFAVASVSSPSVPRALSADPDGATLVAATTGSGMATYGIAADGSLSAAPSAVTPIAMSAPNFLVHSPQQAPVAAFSATQATDGSTSLEAGASQAVGGRTLTRYDWSFGDGTTIATAGPAVSHTYPRAGDYVATLTVTDSAGCSVANTFSGTMAICAGSATATIAATVHVAGSPPAPAILAAPETFEALPELAAEKPEAPRPRAAAATPDVSGKKLLLTWAKPEGAHDETRYLIAWSTLHSSQGPGDPNMHRLRVKGRTSIQLRTRPRTTLHLAVYAYAADGSITRATKTTVRLPR
jgi:hypothetical protein